MTASQGVAGVRGTGTVAAMPMARKISDLRAIPDEVLIEEHDQTAQHTVVGTDYYMDELERRSRERAAEESHRLAVESHRLADRTFWLTVATSVLSVVALVVSVLALVLGD